MHLGDSERNITAMFRLCSVPLVESTKNEAGSTRYISYKASTESEPDAWITGEAAGDVGSFCEFSSFFSSFVHNLLLIYSADTLAHLFG